MVNFSFGKRKLLVMNYSTYISLPKSWLQNNRLTKGDLVELTMIGSGELMLRRYDGKTGTD